MVVVVVVVFVDSSMLVCGAEVGEDSDRESEESEDDGERETGSSRWGRRTESGDLHFFKVE